MLEAVKTLCPDPKYSSLRVNSQLGFVVEADLVLNEHAQPLAVSEYSNLFGQRKPPRDLPDGAVRVAVVSASFQDCLLGGELSGLTAFNTKILQARGYKVVLVRHTHWNPSQNKVSRLVRYSSTTRVRDLFQGVPVGPAAERYSREINNYFVWM